MFKTTSAISVALDVFACGLQVTKKVPRKKVPTLKVSKSTFDKVLGKMIRSKPIPRKTS
jgi:hypothetical protein